MGASADVFSFNRAARALNFLIHSEAGCAATNFFDDFVVVAPAVIVDAFYSRAKRMFKLLGWDLKPKSIIPLDFAFTALGVVFVFEEDARTIRVKN